MNLKTETMEEKRTRTISITAYPYAHQEGTLEIPTDLTEDEVREYVKDHFDDIDFDEVELDYVGTDFDIWEE